MKPGRGDAVGSRYKVDAMFGFRTAFSCLTEGEIGKQVRAKSEQPDMAQGFPFARGGGQICSWDDTCVKV